MTMSNDPLWAHQRQAIDVAKDKYALFFDPGCGKTRTVIEIYIKSQKKRKVLIFAPLNVCRNWPREIEKYLPYPAKCFLVAGGAKAKKIETITRFGSQQFFSDEHLFLICNIECLRSRDYLTALKGCGASFVVLDESHNFKNHSSLQTRGVIELVKSLGPKHLYLLTGTPTPQGEIDLWSTFYLMGVTNDNFFIWRKRHFVDKNERRRGMNNYWPEYVIGPGSKEKFAHWLRSISMTAKKDEVLDLPPLLRLVLNAELGKEQARHYQTMLEYLFAIDAEGHELNASNVLSRTLRLQQILAGLLGDVPIKDNPRLEVLKDAIAMTNGEQFIIWTIFKATYKQTARLLEDLDISFGLLTGEQSSEERDEAMKAFERGELRALVAHPKAGGIGVNLTAASYSIHYTRSYSLTDDQQAEARNYRGGSERHKRITRIDIIAPETIDEQIMDALKEKKEAQDFVMGLKEKYGK